MFDLPQDFETLGFEEFETGDFETFGLVQRVEEVYSEDTDAPHLTRVFGCYYCSLQEKPTEILQT